jgi:Dna[CI] antecedent, DciA
MTYDAERKAARDRSLARKPRIFGRKAESIDHLVKGFMRSPDVQRMRRFAKVQGALKLVLNDRELPLVEPVSLNNGVLTLSVRSAILLGELRNHRTHAILAALIEAGSTATRIAWRLEKT